VRFFRVGLPGLTGLVLLYFGTRQVASGLRDGGFGAVADVRGGLIPIAIAVALILVSLAVSRRSLSGYMLGIATAILMILAGVGLIIVEIPYINEGGLGAAFGGGFVVAAAIWIAVWLGYGLSMRRARASFAAASQPGDRRFAIVIGSLAVFTAAAYLALGFVESDEAVAGEAARTNAVALVAATSIEARVIEVTFQSVGDSAPEVSQMTLELSFMATPAYQLAAIPTVCLTDSATARDPAFKPDVYCWGTAGPALVLADGFRDLTMPSSVRHVQLELARGDSLCAFGPGAWEAQVQIAPLVGDGDTGTAPEVYVHTTTFVVESSLPPPPSGATADGGCFASTVSP
jgi:hypothetical protein